MLITKRDRHRPASPLWSRCSPTEGARPQLSAMRCAQRTVFAPLDPAITRDSVGYLIQAVRHTAARHRLPIEGLRMGPFPGTLRRGTRPRLSVKLTNLSVP